MRIEVQRESSSGAAPWLKAFIVFLMFLVFARITAASPLDEVFGGCARPAIQDTLGELGVWDPFNAAGNPAWAPRSSVVALGSGILSPQLGSRADDSSSSILFLADGQKAWGEGRNVVGVMASLPVGPGSLLDTGDALGKQPFWIMRARHFTIEPYFKRAFESMGLSVGASVPVLFNLDAYSQSKHVDGNDYIRMQAGIRPSLSYALGLSLTVWEPWNFSVAYRERHLVKSYISVNGELPLPGIEGGIPVEDEGESAYAFSPRRISFQASRRFGDSWAVGLLVRFANWAEMPPTFFRITVSKPNFEPTVPKIPTRNTIETGIGAKYELLKHFSFFGAYRFQPTPLKGNVGFYDADQHILGLGIGWFAKSTLDRIYVNTRLQFLSRGGLYSWFGIGVGSDL